MHDAPMGSTRHSAIQARGGHFAENESVPVPADRQALVKSELQPTGSLAENLPHGHRR